MNPDPWRILGVQTGCSGDELKAAFRKKVLQTHPDRGGHAEDFKSVYAAYEALRNGAAQSPPIQDSPETRAQWNAYEREAELYADAWKRVPGGIRFVYNLIYLVWVPAVMLLAGPLTFGVGFILALGIVASLFGANPNPAIWNLLFLWIPGLLLWLSVMNKWHEKVQFQLIDRYSREHMRRLS